jgi:hypothetical protein
METKIIREMETKRIMDCRAVQRRRVFKNYKET